MFTYIYRNNICGYFYLLIGKSVFFKCFSFITTDFKIIFIAHLETSLPFSNAHYKWLGTCKDGVHSETCMTLQTVLYLFDSCLT